MAVKRLESLACHLRTHLPSVVDSECVRVCVCAYHVSLSEQTRAHTQRAVNQAPLHFTSFDVFTGLVTKSVFIEALSHSLKDTANGSNKGKRAIIWLLTQSRSAGVIKRQSMAWPGLTRARQLSILSSTQGCLNWHAGPKHESILHPATLQIPSTVLCSVYLF